MHMTDMNMHMADMKMYMADMKMHMADMQMHMAEMCSKPKWLIHRHQVFSKNRFSQFLSILKSSFSLVQNFSSRACVSWFS